MSPGHDMGQGIATKVKQAAAYALGQALPASQRPFPLDKIQLCDVTTTALPNAGASPCLERKRNSQHLQYRQLGRRQAGWSGLPPVGAPPTL